MSNKKQQEDFFKSLDESPLFHLSMASLELFHSNFLSWLYSIYNEAFKRIITDLIGSDVKWPKKWKVYREKFNYDLCISNTDKKTIKKSDIWFVLENKVKSLPRKEQLDGYTEGTTKAEGRRILLSLVKNFPRKEEISKSSKWIIRDYDNLVNILRARIDEFKDEYHRMLIDDYCEYMWNLSQYVNENSQPQSIGEIEKVIKDCAERGISDVMKKLIYGNILLVCLERIRTINKRIEVEWQGDVSKIFKHAKTESGEYVYVNYGLTNSTGYFELKVKYDEEKVLVIQVQGKDYRRGVQFAKGGEENRRRIKEDETLKKLFSWRKDEIPELAFPEVSTKKDMDKCYREPIKSNPEEQFWSYKKDKKPDQFVYQKIKMKSKLTVDSLATYVVEDLEKLMNLKKEKSK